MTCRWCPGDVQPRCPRGHAMCVPGRNCVLRMRRVLVGGMWRRALPPGNAVPWHQLWCGAVSCGLWVVCCGAVGCELVLRLL